MLFQETGFQASLQRVIANLSGDGFIQEELHQEAVIHVWRMERSNPGQSRSWYLCSCKYHARKILGRGRSIDSPKRASQRIPLPDDPDLADDLISRIDDHDGLLFSEVSARSIESLLLRRLSPLQQKILSFLIEGYSLREIGIELRLSHPAVLRHRRKIAGCARQLGLETYLDRRTGKVLSVRHPSSKNRLHLSYPPSAVREGVVS